MGLDFDYSAGQTPLDEDEKEGLLISTITTRGELDEFEQLGVEKVNELMSLCNALDEKLTKKEKEVDRLVGAVVNRIGNK